MSLLGYFMVRVGGRGGGGGRGVGGVVCTRREGGVRIFTMV